MFAIPRFVLVAAVFVCGLTAQDSPPPVDAALRARFGFVGPINHKVGTGLGFLRAVDWDGDGDDEAVVFHSHRGRLVVLDREAGDKVGEDKVTEEFFDTEGGITGLTFGDVDGDGSMDLVMLDQRGRLSVRLRGAKPRRLPDIEVGIAAGSNSINCGDIDGDKKADVLVMTRDGLRTVLNIVNTPVVSGAMPVGASSARYIQLRDVDGDAALDMVVSSSGRMPLRIKRGDGKGAFGPWLLFRAEGFHAAFPGPGIDGKPTISVIQSRRGRVVDYRLERADKGAAPALQFTSLPPVKRGGFPFAQGDIDGDGDMDLVLAHPDRAELILLREVDGQFRRETAPTLAGVTSLAMGDIDGDGKMDLVIASRDEETLAWKSGEEPFAKFPSSMPFKGRPVAVAIAPGGSVIVMSRDSKRMGKLWQVVIGDEGFAPTTELVALGKLAGEPNRLLVAELDGVPGLEVAYAVPTDGLRVVRFRDGKYLAPQAKSKAPGFTRKMDDGALSLIPGEQASLLVVRERYARRIRFDEAGLPTILEQKNGPAGALGMDLGAVGPSGASLLFDRKSNKLYRVAKTGATESFDVPKINATHVLTHGEDILVLGNNGVVRMSAGTAWQLTPLRDHEPPTKDTEYWYALPGDFDHDGANELALIDEDINGIQVLVAQASALRRSLSFPVLELHDKSESVWEPSWAVVGDWNGDGRDDLILKAYDRILIYIQEL